MKHRRLEYAFVLISSMALLFFFGKSLLLFVILLLIGAVILTKYLLKSDAKAIRIQPEVHMEEIKTRKSPFFLNVACERGLWASGTVVLDIEMKNNMFNEVYSRRLKLELTSNENIFKIPLPTCLSGEWGMHCISACVVDVFGISKSKLIGFEEVRACVYPRPVKIQVERSKETVGSPREDGVIQNRRGSDPSEMFDIREYIPGDDIRSIHWKLSCKTDDLILRQASEPSHYDVVLLLDIGLMKNGKRLSEKLLNEAVANAVSIAEQLIKQGIKFCMAIPTDMGIQMSEIRTEQEFRRALPKWLSTPIQQENGSGLSYFITEQLERYFTRLVIISAGTYDQKLNGLNQRIGVTVVSSVKGTEVIRMNVNHTYEIVELPVDGKKDAYCHIMC